MAPSFPQDLEDAVHTTPGIVSGSINSITQNALLQSYIARNKHKYGWVVKEEPTAPATFLSAHNLHTSPFYSFLKAFSTNCSSSSVTTAGACLLRTLPYLCFTTQAKE